VLDTPKFFSFLAILGLFGLLSAILFLFDSNALCSILYWSCPSLGHIVPLKNPRQSTVLQLRLLLRAEHSTVTGKALEQTRYHEMHSLCAFFCVHTFALRHLAGMHATEVFDIHSALIRF
jgi:hypothetical protein